MSAAYIWFDVGGYRQSLKKMYLKREECKAPRDSLPRLVIRDLYEQEVPYQETFIMPNMYERFSPSSTYPSTLRPFPPAHRQSGRCLCCESLRGELASPIQRGGTKHNNELNYVLRHGRSYSGCSGGATRQCKTGAVAALVHMAAQ